MRQPIYYGPMMTSPAPSIDDLSTPTALVEVEKVCRVCNECWPVTPEFWNKDSKRPDGVKQICRACESEKRHKVVCTLAPETPSKACNTCKVKKPLTKACWHTRKDAPDGFRSKCKTCVATAKNAKHAAIRALLAPPAPVIPEGTALQICKKCGEGKPLHEHFWHRCSRYGFKTQCKTCRNEVTDRTKALKKSAIVVLPSIGAGIRLAPKKIESACCRACNIEKPLTAEFWYRSRDYPTGFKKRCKACTSASQKAFLQNRQEALAALG